MSPKVSIRRARAHDAIETAAVFTESFASMAFVPKLHSAREDQELYVRPGFWNCGIGSALLSHVKPRRPKGFQLWTFQPNAGARRFCGRHGCEAVEFTDRERNEEHTPDVRYCWRGAA